jgi:hypothetical protein
MYFPSCNFCLKSAWVNRHNSRQVAIWKSSSISQVPPANRFPGHGVWFRLQRTQRSWYHLPTLRVSPLLSNKVKLRRGVQRVQIQGWTRRAVVGMVEPLRECHEGCSTQQSKGVERVSTCHPWYSLGRDTRGFGRMHKFQKGEFAPYTS